MKKLYRLSEAELAEMTRIGQMSATYYFCEIPVFHHQEEANRFWKKLAALYGFLWYTVSPAQGEDPAEFLAEPIEPGK